MQELEVSLPEVTHAVQAGRPSHQSLFDCVTTGLVASKYEIRSKGRCVGAIRLHGLFRPRANAQTENGEWWFEVSGGSLVVRSSHSFHELATIDMSFSDHGGILRFSDGRALIFASDFWKGRAEFQTPAGESLVRFRWRGLLRPRGEIEVLEPGSGLPELAWLLMLGWSLIVGYL